MSLPTLETNPALAPEPRFTVLTGESDVILGYVQAEKQTPDGDQLASTGRGQAQRPRSTSRSQQRRSAQHGV